MSLRWIGVITTWRSSSTNSAWPAISVNFTPIVAGSTSWLAIDISYSVSCTSGWIPRLASNCSAFFCAASFCFRVGSIASTRSFMVK